MFKVLQLRLHKYSTKHRRKLAAWHLMLRYANAAALCCLHFAVCTLMFAKCLPTIKGWGYLQWNPGLVSATSLSCSIDKIVHLHQQRGTQHM
jgi:hypothetical protein